MKKLIIFLMVMVLCASTLLAANSSRKTKSPTTSKQPSSKPTVATVRGEILLLNIETKMITVRVSGRQDQTREIVLATDDKTEFKLDGSPVTLVDLKPGMQISAQSESGIVVRVTAKSVIKARPKLSITLSPDNTPSEKTKLAVL